MKFIKWIGHPVVLVIIYLLLIIEGDSFGGFYMVYLLLALPHAVPYSVLAVLGIAGVIVAHNMSLTKFTLLKTLLYLLGLCLMIFSLMLFFERGYSWGTFKLAVPLSTFLLFAVCSICFLIRTFIGYSKSRDTNAANLIS